MQKCVVLFATLCEDHLRITVDLQTWLTPEACDRNDSIVRVNVVRPVWNDTGDDAKLAVDVIASASHVLDALYEGPRDAFVERFDPPDHHMFLSYIGDVTSKKF